MSFEDRKARWRDFMDMSLPPRHMFLIRHDPDAQPRPLPHPDKIDERIEYSWQAYCRHRERAEWLEDDTIPHLNVYTGTEIFAEAFGCDVHRPDDTMPSARPLINCAAEVAKVNVPELSESTLAVFFDIADELRRRAGNGALLKIVDIQSPMDIAALIWEKCDFYAAMIETPEAVKELAAKVGELFTAFLDEWFARYGDDFMAHFPDYYMAKGLTLSEDEVGAVSEDMFLEFFLPELVELSERYGGLGVHCCAHARHQWQHFKKIPNLRLLNLVQPPDVVREAFAEFAADVTQYHHGWHPEGPAWEWPAQYAEGARVVIDTGAETREEAEELSARLCEACR